MLVTWLRQHRRLQKYLQYYILLILPAKPRKTQAVYTMHHYTYISKTAFPFLLPVLGYKNQSLVGDAFWSTLSDGGALATTRTGLVALPLNQHRQPARYFHIHWPLMNDKCTKTLTDDSLGRHLFDCLGTVVIPMTTDIQKGDMHIALFIKNSFTESSMPSAKNRVRNSAVVISFLCVVRADNVICDSRLSFFRARNNTTREVVEKKSPFLTIFKIESLASREDIEMINVACSRGVTRMLYLHFYTNSCNIWFRQRTKKFCCYMKTRCRYMKAKKPAVYILYTRKRNSKGFIGLQLCMWHMWSKLFAYVLFCFGGGILREGRGILFGFFSFFLDLLQWTVIHKICIKCWCSLPFFAYGFKVWRVICPWPHSCVTMVVHLNRL